MIDSDTDTDLFDRPIGAEVEVTIDDEDLVGEIVEVESTVPKEDYPEIGERVTFKAVGGEVEKTVSAIVDGQSHPIRFKEGGAADRQHLVEYSKTETNRVIKLPNGTELWLAQPGGSA